MEIVVCVKQVLDTRLPIDVTDAADVVQKEARPVFVLNPADCCAMQEAARLRHEVDSCHITAITIGPARAKAVLAQCLARGADRVVHLLSDESEQLDSFAVAQALSAEIRVRGFDLILCGNASLDDGAAEVGPVLAELLDIPQVTSAVKLSVLPGDRKLVAERRLERGYRQVVEVRLPALVAVDHTICEPRYVTSRAIRHATAMLTRNYSVPQVLEAARHDSSTALRQVTSRTPPRPRTKKVVTVDEGMSPEDKIAMMMGGPATRPKASQRATGGPEDLADDIIAFLKENGFFIPLSTNR